MAFFWLVTRESLVWTSKEPRDPPENLENSCLLCWQTQLNFFQRLGPQPIWELHFRDYLMGGRVESYFQTAGWWDRCKRSQAGICKVRSKLSSDMDTFGGHFLITKWHYVHLKDIQNAICGSKLGCLCCLLLHSCESVWNVGKQLYSSRESSFYRSIYMLTIGNFIKIRWIKLHGYVQSQLNGNWEKKTTSCSV